MNHQTKKNIGFFLPVIMLASVSCGFSPNPEGQNGQVTIEKQVNFNKKFNIQLKISHLNSNTFKTKATNTSIDGQSSKALVDVKSFSAFLTTDFNDPFASGANPNGNNFMIDVDNTSNISSVTINFANVPRGGPYFAVIGAFDDVAGSINRNNITKDDPSIVSASKKWARSLNSVTILPSGSFIFSDTSSVLNANLALQDGIPDKIAFQVILIDGNTNYTGVPGTTGQF